MALFVLTVRSAAQTRFFKQHWAEYNSSINNTNLTGRNERPRVGDRGMSTDPTYWSRTEAQVNGLVMVSIPDTITNLDGAELYLELWGGHPGTSGKPVKLFYCMSIPSPFWSRAGQLKKAVFSLPEDLSGVESAELHIRVWDGGEGTIKEPFKLNGTPYIITSGEAVHDLVYTVNKVDPKTLKPGLNELELLSDTEHHGIEVCWPGPGLIIKYK